MKQRYLKLLEVLIIAIFLGACTSSEQGRSRESSVESSSNESEWISLFDGETLTGWKNYNQDTITGWVVEEGVLKALGLGADIGGDIIYFLQEFEDFELTLEWKISEGGNSGIFYHVVEGTQYKALYEAAPEYQLLDDLGFPEPVEEWQKLGADYAMHLPDTTKKIVKPAGEWNTSKILFTKENAEYWLNGQKIVQFVPWSDDWYEKRNSGKWEDKPDYGKFKKGYIGLQDHGNVIWFKNIKIQEL